MFRDCAGGIIMQYNAEYSDWGDGRMLDNSGKRPMLLLMMLRSERLFSE